MSFRHFSFTSHPKFKNNVTGSCHRCRSAANSPYFAPFSLYTRIYLSLVSPRPAQVWYLAAQRVTVHFNIKKPPINFIKIIAFTSTWNKCRQAVRGWVIHLAIAFQVRLTCLATSLWHSPSNSLLEFEHLAWIIQHDFSFTEHELTENSECLLQVTRTFALVSREYYSCARVTRNHKRSRNVNRFYHSNCKLSRGVFMIGMKVMSPRLILRCLDLEEIQSLSIVLILFTTKNRIFQKHLSTAWSIDQGKPKWFF